MSNKFDGCDFDGCGAVGTGIAVLWALALAGGTGSSIGCGAMGTGIASALGGALAAEVVSPIILIPNIIESSPGNNWICHFWQGLWRPILCRIGALGSFACAGNFEASGRCT